MSAFGGKADIVAYVELMSGQITFRQPAPVLEGAVSGQRPLWANSGHRRSFDHFTGSDAVRGLAYHLTKDVAPSRQTPPRLSP